MTNHASTDPLDLAEAVANGALRAEDAERQVLAALGRDSDRASEKAIRELRRLVVGARAVRSHARATREALGAESIDLAGESASSGTIVFGPVRIGGTHRRSSGGGGDGAARRPWLLLAAALIIAGGAIGVSMAGGRLVSTHPVPTIVNAVRTACDSPLAGPTRSFAQAGWTAAGGMLTPRFLQTATLLPDGRVLVAGGEDACGAALASAELYDPRTGSWTPTGSMVAPRADHTATLLPDGRVLVAGGTDLAPASGASADTTGPAASAELYDPRTGSWTATGSMVGQHVMHTATLLPDGRVLVAGGTSGPAASAELYDPRTRSWTATGSMLTPRRSHTATLMPDGRVLVVGGLGYGWILPDSAELYDPGSGS